MHTLSTTGAIWIKRYRTLLIVAFGAPLVTGAVLLLASRSEPARVLAKHEQIDVQQGTGRWYHDYALLIGISNANTITDTLTVRVSQDAYDATSVGARVTLGRVMGAKRLTWLSDLSSKRQSVAHFIAARVKSYASPATISPFAVQTAGLARVVRVHSIERRKAFWQKQDHDIGDRSSWMHLVEVEFWTLRTRGLVRTIDAIDAGSMPGLKAGDIVQMHYDQRNPRVLRLDDGMRTFARSRPE